MTNYTILATPAGQWVLPDSDEFLDALGDDAPDYNAVDFAIKNLGFVKWHAPSESAVEIKLNPQNVESAALQTVREMLPKSIATLFTIKHLDQEDWRTEHFPSINQALARLDELCPQARRPAPPSSQDQRPLVPGKGHSYH